MSILGQAAEWAMRGRDQVCESCNATFTCGPLSKGGCWCMQEKVAPEKLTDLKSRFKDCLCPECLRKATAE